jgi:hypothetical protein
MKWVEALKKFNSGKGEWCVPRKGTQEYDEVMSIMSTIKKTGGISIVNPYMKTDKTPRTSAQIQTDRKLADKQAMAASKAERANVRKNGRDAPWTKVKQKENDAYLKRLPPQTPSNIVYTFTAPQRKKVKGIE